MKLYYGIEGHVNGMNLYTSLNKMREMKRYTWRFSEGNWNWINVNIWERLRTEYERQ